MKYLSVCSGIEAASKAWEPLGWEPEAFSEIEPFPSAVLKHHWPKVQNLGDMTKHEQWNIPSGTVDLLVGGTPCQSFSVAGLRQGLKDPRGNLMLTYLAIAERLKPRWLVWENVPGVLSSNGGKDFGSFLGALGELGYEWAYRVLDAQWFGVAQRRRRVFVVAHLGEGSLAAKVLFESESVRRDTPPSRETRQGVATNVEECARSINQRIDAGIPDVCATIDCGLAKQVGKQLTQQAESFYFPIPIHDQATRFSGKHGDKQDGKGNGLGVGKPGDPCPTLTKGDKHAVLYENHPNDSRVTGPHDVAPSCVSRYGTGGGNVPLVQEAIPFRDPSPTLTSKMQGQAGWAPYNEDAHLVGAVAFEPGIATREGSESRFVKELSPTLRKEMGDNQVAVSDSRMAVRRLSPRECERLQGFPDDHTMISWRNKPADQCPDGPRYKALGNSMAVPCMAWIGKRIDAVERNMK
jgi:DNA (cytosine-5)-methyltransferase 1